MSEPLITGGDIDRRLSFRPGTADRKAKQGLLPHVVLPDGTIRYRWADVEQSLTKREVLDDSI